LIVCSVAQKDLAEKAGLSKGELLTWSKDAGNRLGRRSSPWRKPSVWIAAPSCKRRPPRRSRAAVALPKLRPNHRSGPAAGHARRRGNRGVSFLAQRAGTAPSAAREFVRNCRDFCRLIRPIAGPTHRLGQVHFPNRFSAKNLRICLRQVPYVCVRLPRTVCLVRPTRRPLSYGD
jgi:hypothetical protein